MSGGKSSRAGSGFCKTLTKSLQGFGAAQDGTDQSLVVVDQVINRDATRINVSDRKASYVTHVAFAAKRERPIQLKHHCARRHETAVAAKSPHAHKRCLAVAMGIISKSERELVDVEFHCDAALSAA